MDTAVPRSRLRNPGSRGPWSQNSVQVVVTLVTLCRDQPHLIEALDGVSRRLGGVTLRWRFDRMGTVVYVGTDRVVRSFAEVAKHYGLEVAVCPPYRGNRRGVVEKGIRLSHPALVAHG